MSLEDAKRLNAEREALLAIAQQIEWDCAAIELDLKIADYHRDCVLGTLESLRNVARDIVN
jgi:hypothetical protein